MYAVINEMCSLCVALSFYSLPVPQHTQTEHTHTHKHTCVHAISLFTLIMIIIVIHWWDQGDGEECFLSWSHKTESVQQFWLRFFLMNQVPEEFNKHCFGRKLVYFNRFWPFTIYLVKRSVWRHYSVVSVSRHWWVWDSRHVYERTLRQHGGIFPLWVYGWDGGGPGWTGLCRWVNLAVVLLLGMVNVFMW